MRKSLNIAVHSKQKQNNGNINNKNDNHNNINSNNNHNNNNNTSQHEIAATNSILNTLTNNADDNLTLLTKPLNQWTIENLPQNIEQCVGER